MHKVVVCGRAGRNGIMAGNHKVDVTNTSALTAAYTKAHDNMPIFEDFWLLDICPTYSLQKVCIFPSTT